MLEFDGDIEMKPVEELEVPAEKGDSAPDREAEVPQAAVDHPEVEAFGVERRLLPIGRIARPRTRLVLRTRMRSQVRPAPAYQCPMLQSTRTMMGIPR